jgi:peroxiredoxin Q/BCP
MRQIGDLAPDFRLVNQDGKTIALSDFKGKSIVVLFFYPKDRSPGCTTEACSFRDNYLGFKALGAEVIGISADSPQSHRDFADSYKLPFPLLFDEDGRVGEAYGIKKSLGFLPGRATFVVDPQGVICYAMASQLQVFKHVDDSLNVVESISQKWKNEDLHRIQQ